MNREKPLRVAIVSGEKSGDILGADLISALKKKSRKEISLIGVGGRHLESAGLESLFDPSKIALMGIMETLIRIPKLIVRIRSTAKAIIQAKPDILIIIDSPDFTHRVAKIVRAKAPSLPIVNYVCPSVWAWREEHAKIMRHYIDHVLCLLPFEPDALARLDGPKASYVGHRLIYDKEILKARKVKIHRKTDPQKPNLLLLPGSRRREARVLLPIMRKSVDFLMARGISPQVFLSTPEYLKKTIVAKTADWNVKTEIITDKQAKYRAFSEADMALAASGTVALELALTDIPFVSLYKTDYAIRLLRSMIKTWSACLPNIIFDRPIVPECYDVALHPEYIGRHLLSLIENDLARNIQLQGFYEIRRRMQTKYLAGEKGAEIILKIIAKGK